MIRHTGKLMPDFRTVGADDPVCPWLEPMPDFRSVGETFGLPLGTVPMLHMAEGVQ